jgi:hypothetical protein
VGGVLGGAFNGLLAPVLFDDFFEYPIAIAIVCLARLAMEKRRDDSTKARARDVGYGLGLTALTFALVKLAEHAQGGAKQSFVWMYALPVFVAFAWAKRPLRYAVALGGILLVGTTHGGLIGDTIYKERDFFGVLKVRRDPAERLLVLFSGNTIHGAQSLEPASARVPLTYYHPSGPAGDVLGPLPASAAAPEAAHALPAPGPRRVGVIGLGIGSLAAYARAGDTWTFFELNPLVVDIARHYFTYLSTVPAGAEVAIEMGDARLRLRAGAAARFDVLVLDAFSSDSVPLHLVTREALTVYRRALAPGGLLLAHISNRHVELEPIFATLAHDAGLLVLARNDPGAKQAEREAEKTSSHWVVLGDASAPLGAVVAKSGEWHSLARPANQKVWTDDFADVLGAMRF